MEASQNKPTPMEKNTESHRKSWLEAPVQSILLTVITAALLGGFIKVTTISDNVIIIKEQAAANREIINQQGNAIRRLENNDLDKNNRITTLEIEFRTLQSKSK